MPEPIARVRLLAVDLDGTLLNSESEVSEVNRRALRDAADCGVQIVVVTGRRFHSAARLVAQIPCPVTVISSNGARIGSVAGDRYHQDFLPRWLARQTLEASRDFRRYAVLIFDLAGRGQVVMQDGATPDGPLGWYLRNAPDALLMASDLEGALDEDPIQVMFGGPSVSLDPLEEVLRRSPAGPALQLTWTRYPARNISLLDVMNLGCTKGSALSRWCRECGIAAEHVMAIGDNHNDCEMLGFAGYPVLMANRPPSVDGAGCLVTLSNDQDGVAAAIERFILKP